MEGISKKYWYALGALTLFLLFYANDSLWITDNVESNYALTAKEMVESGDWISPQIFGQYWFDKPIMFYFLTSLAFKVFGINEFAAHFFPAVFGCLSIVLIAWTGRRLFSEKAGFYAAVVLLSSFEFFLISKIVITDAVLFVFFSLALVMFLIAYTENKPRYYYGFYAFTALAVLTKGPIGLLLPGFICVVFLLIKRDIFAMKNMKLFSGLAVFLLIAMPWYGAMYAIHGSAFIDGFLGTHNFLRATVSEHPKDNVIYYYTLVLMLAAFPWVGFIPAMLKNMFRYEGRQYAWQDRRLFLVVWAVIVFIFFQCMATKYLTYTYPMMFPVALLLGEFFSQREGSISILRPMLWNLVFFAAFIYGVYLAALKQGLPLIAAVIVAIPVIIGLGSIIVMHKRIIQRRIIAIIALTAVCFNIVLINEVCMPLVGLRSAKLVGEAAAQVPKDKEIFVYGDYPTSAVFYSGRKMTMLVESKDMERFQPTSYSWSSKNVMPYAEMQNSLRKENIVVIMQKDEYEKFLAQGQNSANWKTRELNKEWMLAEKQL